MKKALEWELALDSRDLRSHAWYHGPIPRQKTEELLKSEGDFLIRDCASQPGNFVLSCKSKNNQTLHFVINKVKFCLRRFKVVFHFKMLIVDDFIIHKNRINILNIYVNLKMLMNISFHSITVAHSTGDSL